MNKKYQVLRCGRLYDGVTQEWKSSQSILVEDHLIVEVGSNVSVPEGANVIDLTDCQVTPGMIDAHMHMDYFDWHTVREEVYTQSEEAKTLAIARCAEKALRRGFTTVRHVGGITSNGYGVLDVSREAALWRHRCFCVLPAATGISARTLREIRCYPRSFSRSD